jgi:hypothetical protein
VPAGTGSFGARCWCEDVTIAAAALARVPDEERGLACLCRQCATATTGGSDRDAPGNDRTETR